MNNQDYKKEITKFLLNLPHKYVVSFALYCAEDVYSLVNDKDKIIVRNCLDKIYLWLNGKASTEEVKAAADAYATIGAADAAIGVADADAAAYTAIDAAYAVYATVYATIDITYATNAAANAAVNAIANAANAAIKVNKYEQYLTELKRICNNITDLEKLVWRLE